MSLLITGSIALDSVRTPVSEQRDLLGGSASYASIAASFYTPVNLVGIVGSDFPRHYLDLYRRHGINLDGLEIANGPTFRWSGEYEWDMNRRRTLSVALNVFEKFHPTLPAHYRDTPFVFLANISPQLQLHVLSQMRAPRFVVADTMDLWIETTRDALLELLRRIDCLVLNESEAREFTRQTSLIKAGRQILKLGPRYVIIKKGEHGCLLFAPDLFFSAPAYPLEDIHDPTGAGDSFAGAFTGYLARTGIINHDTLRKAVIHGSVVASYCVEAFSLQRLERLTQQDIEQRYELFRLMSHFEVG
ncbi:MAG: PfkB family carbohydrate kinase [Verrucomicrobiae bacterium]|nr:PfkB family carbohydrate kinase [Verrucomicrobiae bacterium]MDW8344472.1 PfkB family carbohydrate kinase [Verrucomicrobiae bacterium]